MSKAPSEAEKSAIRGPAITDIPKGSHGPFLSPTPSGSLMVWAVPQGQTTAWFTRPIDSQGVPTAVETKVATAAAPASLVSLRPFAGGVIGLSTSAADGSWFVNLVVFDSDGSLRTSPSAAVRTPLEVLWMDAVSFEDESGLLFWAVRDGDAAGIFTLAMDAYGRAQGDVTQVHASAAGWQVRRLGDSAVLGVVTASREVEFLVIDGSGVAVIENTIPDAENAGLDLDLLSLGDQMLATFSATHRGSRQIFTIRLGADGGPVGRPRLAVKPRGEQTPTSLFAGIGGERWLSWRSLEQYPNDLLLGKLNPSGVVVGPHVRVPIGPSTARPALAAGEGGVHVLVMACETRAASGDCTGPTSVERWVFDAELQHLSRESVQVGAQPANLGWGAHCEKGGCFGLAAVYTQPPRVKVVSLQVQPGAITAEVKTTHGEPPFADSISAALSPQALADFAVTDSSAGHTVAWLTDFDPATPYKKPSFAAPDGRMAPERAHLVVQFIPATSDSNTSAIETSPTVISYRARSTSGISLSSSSSGQLLVWSALDPNTPQVFATLLDSTGKKRLQASLTRRKGEVLDVTSAAFGKQWLVGWVDKRSGAPRAYISKFGSRLGRLNKPRAIGSGDADAVSIEVRTVGKEAWVLVSSATHQREAEQAYLVVLQRFDAKTLRPLGEHLEVAHSTAPIVSVGFAAGERPVVHWVREGRAALLFLSAEGRPVEERAWLESANVTFTRASCDAKECRALAVKRLSPGSEWFGAVITKSVTTGASSLVRSADSAAAAFEPELTSDGMWFYDTTSEGAPRLSEAKLRWQ